MQDTTGVCPLVGGTTRRPPHGTAWYRGLEPPRGRGTPRRGRRGALLTVHKAMRLPTLAHSQDRPLARRATGTLTGLCRGRRT